MEKKGEGRKKWMKGKKGVWQEGGGNRAKIRQRYFRNARLFIILLFAIFGEFVRNFG